ncbi:uncharacterized protein ACA1_352730 [Acanthamoeba castellanii str. Neff]|uniref:Proliferating cell nuclear antigen n=1 Tax=Acanthamoeba castellanii (strain ATCC 30010 / Neff) TaxID=1257118 RepID=L8H5F0_ACACF|nr:uncharacterized protein ACA1_352730 [Acanthamoeba castellanii str. Neff]ELR20405.1 hypothetical protein ACA1_352730 [Acanthamoeba castellanii str. Neff]
MLCSTQILQLTLLNHERIHIPVLTDACLDLGRQGDELHVEVKRGKGVCFSEHDHSELFVFKYFASIAKGCASLPECEALLMQLGSGLPLSLLCQLTNTGHLNFFLAPLIQTN